MLVSGVWLYKITVVPTARYHAHAKMKIYRVQYFVLVASLFDDLLYSILYAVPNTPLTLQYP